MLMSEESWHRHSNPWSVYTRFACLPLISLAFFSREWFGGYAIIFVCLSFVWVWLNPRLFSAPEKTDNWASMGTFGERIYLNRKNELIPLHHLRFSKILLLFTAIGLPFFLYGLYTLEVWILILANLWIMVFKTWFVDRMVWLYMDMKDSNPKYQAWLKS